MRPVLNMTELEDCEYVKVTQDAEYALVMPQYAWIFLIILNMFKLPCIYLNFLAYTRVLNMPEF